MNTFFRLAYVLVLICSFAVASRIALAGTVPVVTVSDHCSASDNHGTAHAYANGQFLGICALVAAQAQGAIGTYTLAYDDSFGFYVESINGAVPSSTQYWALYLNGAYANDGLSSMTLVTGDSISFQLTDFTDNSQIGAPISFSVTTAAAQAPASTAGGGGGLTLHAPFDVAMALYYISQTQRPDGSFDSPLLSDWAAFAFANGGAGDARARLSQYFVTNPPAPGSITDDERHAMALEALGINPYSDTAVDYISPIVAAFDGTQIEDPSLVNDDIFALFPLLHAGYHENDDIIKKTTAFVVSKQLANGSWENSVDLTAAALQALSLVRQISGASSAITPALSYLHAQEQADGSFGLPGKGNSFSTSWALQAIAAVPDSPFNWSASYHTPQYYLATLQERDGGVEPADTATSTRVWATEYAVPAVQGKTWPSLLKTFARPVRVTQSASTTPPVTISTPLATTTTQDVVSATPTPAVEIPTAETTPEQKTEAVTPRASGMSPTPTSQAAAASGGGEPFGKLWRRIISFFFSLF